jgi:predicted nucleic acid-binding protein
VKSLVLDASIAIKWIAPTGSESLMPEAAEFLRRYVEGEIDFVVPDIFWAEVSHVLSKGVRRGRWGRKQAELAEPDMESRKFISVSSRSLLPEAFRIALDFDCSVYDCIYVAVAAQIKTEFITADEGLVNALAARFPVRWLGGIGKLL